MPKLFAVMAIMEDPRRVWPVAWSIDLGPMIEMQKACIDQAAKLADALTGIWAKQEKLEASQPSPWIRDRRGQKNRNRAYDEEITKIQRDREKLEAEEMAISKKHTDLMYDALFPVGNEGWLPEVKYVIWPLAEDMRADFTFGELILMRAQLHATEQSDAYLIDLGTKEDG